MGLPPAHSDSSETVRDSLSESSSARSARIDRASSGVKLSASRLDISDAADYIDNVDDKYPYTYQ